MAHKYYRILDDIRFHQRWQLDAPISEVCDVDPSDFTSGRLFTHNTLLTVLADDGIPLDFTLAELDVPIVTARLGIVIEKLAKDDVQLIPVEIAGVEGEFAVLNTLCTIDCLNEERSKFTKWQIEDGRPEKIGEYRMVAKLVVDTNRIGSSHIFRVRGWDVPLIVSETIRQTIIEGGFKGALFQPVSG